ncbi:MAG: MFS transporter, partial [Pseudomonadota bacterium]
ISISLGWPYLMVARRLGAEVAPREQETARPHKANATVRWKVIAFVYLAAALGSITFQSTTFALPEIFEERVSGLAMTIGELREGSFPLQSTSILGALVFSVFAAASLTQLLIGYLLDRYGARPAIALVTSIQIVFFLLMHGQTGLMAYAVALGFMLGVFGQIPINDFLIGKTATGRFRSRAFGVRYLVTFTTLAATLPMIAVIHDRWGFDRLFLVLAILSGIILVASRLMLAGPQAIKERRRRPVAVTRP